VKSGVDGVSARRGGVLQCCGQRVLLKNVHNPYYSAASWRICSLMVSDIIGTLQPLCRREDTLKAKKRGLRSYTSAPSPPYRSCPNPTLPAPNISVQKLNRTDWTLPSVDEALRRCFRALGRAATDNMAVKGGSYGHDRL